MKMTAELKARTDRSYITTIDRPDPIYHRSPVIIHRDYQWHFADMDNMKQLHFLADTLGFTFKLESEEKPWFNGGIYRKYSMSHLISESLGSFWKRNDVPQNARPIKALSNGSIVTCYFTNDGETICIYRPNPNATEANKNRYKTQAEYEKAVSNRVYYPNSLKFDAVYDPLPLSEHIAHVKMYGCY